MFVFFSFFLSFVFSTAPGTLPRLLCSSLKDRNGLQVLGGRRSAEERCLDRSHEHVNEQPIRRGGLVSQTLGHRQAHGGC